MWGHLAVTDGIESLGADGLAVACADDRRGWTLIPRPIRVDPDEWICSTLNEFGLARPSMTAGLRRSRAHREVWRLAERGLEVS